MSELHLITGGAGCIGSELAGALLAQGHAVIVLDNLSSGRYEHISALAKDPKFMFVEDSAAFIRDSIQGVSMVWHLCAKTDIKFGTDYDYTADILQNFGYTWAVLRAMHEAGVKRLAFASSAAVYGDPWSRAHCWTLSTIRRRICEWCGEFEDRADSEECTTAPMATLFESMRLEPVSMYGATKLGCEAIIRAMALRAGIQSWIFRYCSIVSGKARTSGNMVIPDLIHKLQKDPTRLEILGDGNQTKPSLLVSECVDAMLHVVEHCKKPVSIHNIGAPDAISVTRQAELICEAMGLKPEFVYTGGAGGWPGDVPSFRMNCDKLAALGWRAKRTSEQAVREAIAGLLESGE